MTKVEELENIKLNISSLIWQIRNFTPLASATDFHLQEALGLADELQVEVMLATAKEESV